MLNPCLTPKIASLRSKGYADFTNILIRMKHHYPDCQGGPDCNCCEREQDSRALPCSLCGVAPHLPELRTDASGNHSTAAIIGCGCGVQVRVECGNRYAARPGDSGWSMIGGNWDMSLREAVEKWNLLHKANA